MPEQPKLPQQPKAPQPAEQPARWEALHSLSVLTPADKQTPEYHKMRERIDAVKAEMKRVSEDESLTKAQRMKIIAGELMAKLEKAQRFKRSGEQTGDFLNFDSLQNWLKDNDLEKHLEGGRLEALINKQEQFYQQSYGKDFRLDLSAIKIESSRLELIQKGLENGSVNYPLLTVIPERLTPTEAQMTQAEFAYHKLLEPLKAQGLKIWAETGADRWTKLTLPQVLKGYIPVELNDFNPATLETNWQTELARVIAQKQAASTIIPGQTELTFTDSRQDVPKEQPVINQEGKETANQFYFIEMIKNQVKVLTPEQWITLAAQKYQQDKIYLSRNTWDWMMAVLKNKDGVDPPVSAAYASFDDDEVYLNSDDAGDSGAAGRWRSAL